MGGKITIPVTYDKICGIYRITNNITGKSYIGQSQDIWKRMYQHFYHRKSLIDQDMYKYKGYFSIDILCRCKSEELDYYEQYYIKLYSSLNDGYNQTFGGKGSIGITNPTNKLTEEEVYQIREDYNNHVPQKVSYEKYKDKVTFNSFQNIWQGQSWKNTHMDVYTERNKEYYKTGCFSGSKFNTFTDEEVIEMRKRYVNETAGQIFESLPKGKCTFQTLQQILFGRFYIHLPIYDKRAGEWI